MALSVLLVPTFFARAFVFTLCGSWELRLVDAAALCPACEVLSSLCPAQVKTVSVGFSGVDEHNQPKLTWDLDALNALHEASEDYLTELFQASVDCQLHAKRSTLKREDMQLARKLTNK
jgi:hypothetical protein